MKNLNINDGQSSDPSPAATLHEGTFNKVNDALNRGPKSQKVYTRPPRPNIHTTTILDKIGGHIKFSDGSAAPTPPPTAVPNQESFLDKIGDAPYRGAVSSSHSASLPVMKEDPEGLFDKIWDILHEGNKSVTPPALREDEGSLVGDAIIIGKNDKSFEKSHGGVEDA